MKEINWNIFKAKFNGKETCSFESLAYQLFCSEHGNRIGIFRFKNQIGIETEPIEVYGKLIGFQAKFYDTKILDNKYDIIDSLKKAKRENSNLNSVLFYLNQEFSESSTKGKKDPEYKTELETKAKKLNLTIEWRVPSHFERQLALPENHYLAEFFFEQGKGMVDFLVEIKKHTENLLHSIQTDILYGDQTIKIDRSSEISALESWVGNSSALIVSGEGGCGKTAIIKELFIQLSQSIPFYGFKAAEFNLPHIKALFSNYGKYSLNDFIQSHSEESRKIVLIDSAEKISDLDNQEPLKEFLIELLKNSWTVIFTTRLSYLDDLRFQFLSIFRLSFQEITINNLSPRELESLAVQYSFELPSNKKLKSLIQNPFYLDEYLDNYTADGNLSSYAQFKESIWLRKIQRSSFTKNNTHILRERCFLNIVKSRTEQGTFFVSANNCNEDILALLRDDEIIGFDRNSGGYFITHDIYEEWGQNILIERAYHARTEYVDFLKEIGNSLSIRRAFRNWLSGKLYDGIDEIKSFIESSFTSDSIEPFWKDEILTSVLLSDYAHAFFTQFKEFILADKHTILKKVIFLLRISCKEIDDSYLKILGIEDEINLNYIFTKPKGSGWSRVVNLVFENRNSFELDSLHYIFPILQEWSSYNKTGQTTRQVGLLALKYYNTIQSHEDLAYDSDVIDELVKVIIHSTVEIRDELVKIFDAVLEKGEIKRKELNYDLCKILVSSDNDIMPVIIGLPDYVLRFADLFWYDTGRDRYQYDRMGVESYYAISSGRDYSPASAEQTPIYWLLYSYYKRTVDFIIDFTNRTIKAYADSGFDDSVEEVELTLSSGKRKKQYLSHSLWNMYRGSGSSVTPDLLQSIHMALEKILLGMAEKQDRKSMESKLIYLIENSDSASISSVVASVVIANPDKFYNVAKILFSSSSFILQDRIRSLSGEREAESINSFGFGLDYKTKRFEDERAETFKQKHRSNSLEGLIINYQFFKDEHTTDQEAEDRKNELWEIIDKLHKTLPAKSKETENDKNLRLLLAGIDRRKMNPKLERQGDKVLIDFNPEIEPDLQKHKEQALEQTSELMKYTPLNLWAENKFNQRNSNNDYQQYESNPALVLKETREIVKGYDSNQNLNYFRFSKAIPAYTCSVLIREYSSSLSEDDLQFCKEIIVEYATKPLFQEEYGYQISDGVEVSVNAIPFLMELVPDCNDELASILLLILFDTHPLGYYKRICDYSIESIQRKLWSSSPEKAKQILFAFLKFKPIYHTIQNDIKEASIKVNEWPKYTQCQIIDELLKIHGDEIDGQLKSSPQLENLNISAYSLDDIEIAFQLVPDETTDESIKNLVSNFNPVFAKDLLKDNRDIDYSLRNRVFKKCASFILNQDVSEIGKFITPYVEEFRFSKEVAHFFKALIFAEDNFQKYAQFWFAWKFFYNQVTSKNSHYGGYYLSEVVHNYLLAGNLWKETAKNWHSLKDKEKNFFKKIVNDIGHLPCVFDSIAKFLNEIGSEFLDEGIFWVAELVDKNSNNKLEKNTTYFVEKLARKYVYLNRAKVKQDIKIKQKIVTILNFLIEKSSVNAYLLREDIL